jgi:hypothetical protein
MNSRLMAATTLFAVAWLLGCETPEEGFKSGPQKGSSSISPFNPLHVTGDGAGGKSCLV